MRDTENVPLPLDIALPIRDEDLVKLMGPCEEYLKREVLPHVPDAWIDHSKTKVGYEVPLNRHFYVYQPPRDLREIEADIKKVEKEILADAMVNLQMIDTIGSGIKRVFNLQRSRFFPMPDYDLSDAQRVRVRLSGKILDENYSRLLISRTDLSLIDVIALDRVQKKKPLSSAEVTRLKRLKLIEGRRPNLFVSARIAEVTHGQADYIRHRAFDKDHYKKLVLSLLREFGPVSRKEIDRLLLEKLPDILTPQQKENRIRNLLQEMSKKDGSIRLVDGPGPNSRWSL